MNAFCQITEESPKIRVCSAAYLKFLDVKLQMQSAPQTNLTSSSIHLKVILALHSSKLLQKWDFDTGATGEVGIANRFSGFCMLDAYCAL